jgi:hypothetical protein
MRRLDTAQLLRATRIFLALAYPEGEHTIPPVRRLDLLLASNQPLETLLSPPICQTQSSPAGESQGYAFRLGSGHFPHMKLQVSLRDDATCVFSVDTHDAIRVDPDHPEAQRWAHLQTLNRQLKAKIEQAWDADGLLTFHGLLRRELGKPR